MTAVAISSATPRTPRRRLGHMIAATLVAGAVQFSGTAMAQQASIEKDFPLPPVISEMQKKAVRDFESKKAGLGYGFPYGKKGAASEIFIYDIGVKNIPSGPKNDIITSHMEKAKQEIYAAQKTGAYSGVQLKSTFDVSNAAGKPVFTCAAFSYTRKDIGAADSYLCLTGAAKKFVKVRMTMVQSADSKAAAERFISELAGVLPQ